MNYYDDDMFSHSSRVRTPSTELPSGYTNYQPVPVPYYDDTDTIPIPIPNGSTLSSTSGHEPTLEEIAKATAIAYAKRKSAQQSEDMSEGFARGPGISFYKKNGSYVFEIPESFLYIILLVLIMFLLFQMTNAKKRIIVIQKDQYGKEIVRELQQ